MFLYFNCLKPTVAGVLTLDGSKRCGRIGAERLCGAGYLVVGDHAVERKKFPSRPPARR